MKQSIRHLLMRVPLVRDQVQRAAALERRVRSLEAMVANLNARLESLDPAKPNAKCRLQPRKLDVLPVPHLICDDVLTQDEIAACMNHWPEFLPEESLGSGYRVLHLSRDAHTRELTEAQRAFWSNFTAWPILPLVKELYAIYWPWIFRKFGDQIGSIQPVTVALTEFDGHYVAAGCHVHRHDPTWLFTNLIHIDDGENERADERGNAIFGFDSFSKAEDYNEDILSRLCRATPHGPVEGLDIRRCYSFKPGRLFSFFETPISYHGSRPGRPDMKATGRRRMIRMHVTAPHELTRELYGVRAEEFRKLQYKVADPLDPRVKNWMKRDIDAMFEAAASPAAHNSRAMEKVALLPPSAW